ncbi:Phosphodiesterase, partial [Gryllus bimaculatus]
SAQRRSRQLRHLDEKELIFELVKDICHELDVRSLCHKILQNVSVLLRADRCSLFLVRSPVGAGAGTGAGAGGEEQRYLVPTLFDVSQRSTLQQQEQLARDIRVPWGAGVAGFVAASGQPVNIPDAYQDERFSQEVDLQTGYRTRALLCMPIKDGAGEVIGVAQVINKQQAHLTGQSPDAAAGAGAVTAFSPAPTACFTRNDEQVLLDLARMIFEEQSTIEHVVFRILTHTQSLIQCQRVQVLLVHRASRGSFSRVFDFEASDVEAEERDAPTSPFESRFPIHVGISGYVATTGELINKFDDLPFTKNDENFVEAFAIFCGMGIHNTHMYEKAVIAMAKQSVTLEVLSYHASASLEDAQRLRNLRVPSSQHFGLHDFKFDDIHMDDDDTLKACIRMFLDLDFIERFHIDYEVLCRWLLSVKKNYRQVTYHNWRHAFNVAQMMFAIITTTQWWKSLGEIECLALLIACLCHDLDHRGTNNSFQIKASSPLAQLYSTSTMEHHHFDQKRGSFLSLVRSGAGSPGGSLWHCEEQRELLRAMTMTVCDLAAITKPWEVEKRVAELVSSEFFEQGDIERQELKITPIDIMNREKEDQLPMMQVGFIDSICLPIYEAFAQLSDKLEPLVEGVRQNKNHWLEIAGMTDAMEAEEGGEETASSSNEQQ